MSSPQLPAFLQLLGHTHAYTRVGIYIPCCLLVQPEPPSPAPDRGMSPVLSRWLLSVWLLTHDRVLQTQEHNFGTLMFLLLRTLSFSFSGCSRAQDCPLQDTATWVFRALLSG